MPQTISKTERQNGEEEEGTQEGKSDATGQVGGTRKKDGSQEYRLEKSNTLVQKCYRQNFGRDLELFWGDQFCHVK